MTQQDFMPPRHQRAVSSPGECSMPILELHRKDERLFSPKGRSAAPERTPTS